VFFFGGGDVVGAVGGGGGGGGLGPPLSREKVNLCPERSPLYVSMYRGFGFPDT
jgi:hypothetical protein